MAGAYRSESPERLSPMSKPDFFSLTVGEAAAYVGLSASTLNKLRVFGGGPIFIKLGHRVVYDRADLDAWMNARRRRSTSDDGSVAIGD